jgi:hypothetical protein
MSARELIPLLAIGQLTRTEWNLPDKLSEPQWLEAGKALARIDGTVMWWVGDWWAFGEHAYGNRKAVVEQDGWEGPGFQTCADAAWVAQRFETSRRREVLSWPVHREVASLPPDEADRVLDWCEEVLGKTKKPPTIKALRERVKEIKRYLAEGWDSDQLERREQVEQGVTVLATLASDDDKKPLDGALLRWADAHDLLVRIDRQSDWGNPYEMPKDGDRATVIESFRDHYLPRKYSLLKRIPELKGKVLACWCYPEACHSDVLVEMANATEDERAAFVADHADELRRLLDGPRS